jgi:hypothetical protein
MIIKYKILHALVLGYLCNCSGGVQLRAFHLFWYNNTIARSARITKNMILTVQRRTIAREMGCDVVKFFIKQKLSYVIIIFNI